MKPAAKASLAEWPKSRHLMHWEKKHPALRIALRQAKQRFGKLPGVQGFGVGKKLKGKSGKIVRSGLASGGLCIHVFVAEKKPKAKLGRDLLPQDILVKVRGRKTRIRVPLDVVCLGEPQAVKTRAVLEAGPNRGITVTSTTNIGRIFGITPRPSGTAGVEAGTIGAFIRGDSGQCYGVTAGHVVINTATPPWLVPSQGKILHLADRQGAVPASIFYPKTLGNPPFLFDTIIIRVSPALMPPPPNCSWPSVFDGNLAAPEDSESALGEDRERSFLWIQRERQIDPAGQTSLEPWALEVNIIGKALFQRPSLSSGEMIKYPELWWYRYPRLQSAQVENPWQMSVGGDSGAGLFVPASENPNVCRLLGFHIYRYFDAQRGQWWGLAMPAEQILQMIAGQHRDNWWFYGKE